MNQLKQYFTIEAEGETVLELKRSRFICRAKHVKSIQEANQWIQAIQRKHHDATHNCYAYVIDPHTQKSSDDGEPAGTAGRPILETLLQYPLYQAMVIITRYFGGIKLGASGLVRAYRQAAQLAIESAGVVQKKLHQQLLLQFDYSSFGKIEHALQIAQYPYDPPAFAEQVRWSIWIPCGQETAAIKTLKDITQGKIQIEFGRVRHKSVTC